MEPHRHDSRVPDATKSGKRRRRADSAPLDARWLEDQGARYLARTEASKRALADSLERKLRTRGERDGVDVQALIAQIPDVVESLAARGYVDDHRFARELYDRSRRDGRSRARIRAKLVSKGIDEQIIRDVEAERADAGDGQDASFEPDPRRAEDEELSAALRTARKRRLGPFHPDPERREALREKHLGVLARGGFSFDVALRIVDASLEAIEAGELDR